MSKVQDKIDSPYTVFQTKEMTEFKIRTGAQEYESEKARKEQEQRQKEQAKGK